jgi:MFS family permease
VYHTGAGAFGLASTAFAVGALGGALLAARRGKPSLAWLLVMSLAFSLTEIVGSLMPDFVLFLVLLIPTGLALLSFSTAANSVTQLSTTAAMRGRVMGLYMLVFLGGTPVGGPLAGWIAEAAGPRAATLAGGAIALVSTMVVTVLLAHAHGARARSLPRRALERARQHSLRLPVWVPMRLVTDGSATNRS